MGTILYSILLLILGLLGAAPVVERSIPALTPFIDKLRPYKDIIGIIGLVAGILQLVLWLFVAYLMFTVPFRVLLSLASAVATFLLGVIFGVEFLRKNIKDPTVSFPIMPKIELFRNKVMPYEKLLGEAAIVCAILNLALLLSHV